MTTRTTAAAVKQLLAPGGDYREGFDVTPFIESAAVLVDDLAQYASESALVVSNGRLELIERWLAAHFYKQSDKGYRSRSTEGASGNFEGDTGKYLESSRYGQTAISMDPTGYLANMAAGGQTYIEVGGVWLGQRTQEQQDYNTRNL